MKDPSILVEFWQFLEFVFFFFRKRLRVIFGRFEWVKGGLVVRLYRKRGKYAGTFIHSGMMGLLFVGVTLGPLLVVQNLPKEEEGQTLPSAVVLGVYDQADYGMTTMVSEKPRAEMIEYEVREGDTLSSIAKKFDVSLDSVLWANGLTEKSKIKAGQVLKVPPVTGVVHTVKKGETVYSVAKKYETEPQGIVDYPFNTFVNDETFALAVGQILMVPDGIMPEVKPVSPRTSLARRVTPDAGVVSATGQFVWPAAGRISQGFRWYHPGIDIANKSGGAILAADAGRVTVAGWPDNYGYGSRVIIDHGNGLATMYAHLAKISVVVGQTVNRGDVIGQMGSTGRSTGIHLHFEIRKGGVSQNPLNYLK